jgi:hypothetical protein
MRKFEKTGIPGYVSSREIDASRLGRSEPTSGEHVVCHIELEKMSLQE